MRMLTRWKKYLDELGRDPLSGGLIRNKELAEKWGAVNKLHAEEWDGLKIRINLLRKSE